MIRDGIGIAAMAQHIIDRDGIVAYHPAALTCLRDFHQVELLGRLVLRLHECTGNIQHIGVVHEKPVVVVIIITRSPFAGARTLNCNRILSRIFIAGTCSDGNIGASRTIDDYLGKKHATALRGGDNQSLHLPAFAQRTTAHRTEPQFSSGF